MALIERDNGALEEIYPGSKIAHSDWMVAFLDQDKAILKRISQKCPKEIVVYLESRKEPGEKRISMPVRKPVPSENQIPRTHDLAPAIPGPIVPSKKPKHLDQSPRIFGPEILPPEEVPMEPTIDEDEEEKEKISGVPEYNNLNKEQGQEEEVSFNGKKAHLFPPGEM